MNKVKVVAIGLGYIGLPTSALPTTEDGKVTVAKSPKSHWPTFKVAPPSKAAHILPPVRFMNIS